MREHALEEVGQGRQPEPAQHRTEWQFRRLLEKLPAGAYTCNPEGLITYFNQHAVQLWGRAPKLNDPVDRFCGSFKLFSKDGSPINHDQCWMALALQTDKEYNGHEIVIERPNGQRLTALAHANPFRDESGKLLGAVNVLVEITDRKRLEDMLQQRAEELAEADRRKDEFLAMLAHELRNPLAPIRNALQIIRLGGAEEAADRARAIIERQVQHMVRLIDDLLDVSRITRGKINLHKEPVDLATVVIRAIETSRPLIDSRSHELSVSLPTEPLRLEADPTRLEQILANLLNNAAKYTEPGGRIWLVAERLEDQVELRVRDTGIGVAPDMLPHVFDLFMQAERRLDRSQGGLGIGLTLVRSLVEMHGGTVRACSPGLGQGSEFIVRLPVLPAAEATQPETTSEGTGAAERSLRVLLVEDNIDAAESLAIMLRLWGHEVRTVHDGSAALEAAAFQPEVVLLDIGLVGMDGYQVAKLLRDHPGTRKAFLVALTGYGREDDRRRSQEAGFNRHLVKPVDPDTLQGLLANLKPSPDRTA